MKTATKKVSLTPLQDMQDNVRYINPAQVAQIYLTGGKVDTESVVAVELTSGTVIHAIGFGSGLSAIENCADQLNISIP